MKYWDYEKNDEAGLFPSEVKHGFRGKCYFKCSKGHSFTLAPESKQRAGNDVFICKICNPCGRKVKLLKDFLDEDKKKYFKQENNIEIDYNSLGMMSRKIIVWECDKKHLFKKKVSDFTRKSGTSCPTCRSLGLNTGNGNTNSVQFTLGKLSSNTSLMKEWSPKNTLDPESISMGCNRTKVWWKCPKCSNEWKARVYARAVINSGCPDCKNKRRQSRNEIRISTELSSLFTNVISNYIVDGYKYDVYIKDINLLIEYDGFKWHSYKSAIANDQKKNKIAIKNNFNLLRIREKGLPRMFDDDILLDISSNKLRTNKSQIYILSLLIDYIIKNYELNFNDYKVNYLNKNIFINEDEYYLKLNKGIVDNNLTKHPKFKEFCEIKNKIDPKCIAMGSHMKVWWKCDKGIDHSWEEQPANRKVGGCPYCSNKRLSVTNQLDIVEPKSVKLWSTKNKTRPSDYTFRNGKVNIIWNCNHCSKEFSKNIDKMIDTNGYCPHCKNYHFK